MTRNWQQLPLTFVFCWLLCIIHGTGEANSFPFRSINPGETLPSLTLNNFKDGTSINLATYQGHPLVLIFWGADLEAKKERSLKTFMDVQKMQPFLQEHSVAVVSVNTQGDPAQTIEEIITKASFFFPVLLDTDRKAYGSLGIFIMPSILLLDKDGKVVAGMGYSHDFAELLQGEISILSGEKNREQVEAELRPEIIEKSKEEKASRRHIQMGKVMLEQGMPERAIENFQEALKLFPDSAEAHIELACSYLEAGQTEKAEASLSKGLELAPDSFRGLLCDAMLSAALGSPDDGINDLQALMLRNARKPELHYSLGLLYQKKGAMDKAAGAFRKACELLMKHD